MKKWMLTISAVLLFVAGSFAQAYFEMMPSAGYTFSNEVSDGNSYGKIDGNYNIGGSMMFNVNRRVGFEMMYNHLATTSGEYSYGQQQAQISHGSLSVDNIMFGPVGTFNVPGSPVRPFIGGLMGATIFTPGTTGYSNDTRFTVGAEFGTNVYFNPWIGLRFKAQVLAPLDGSGQGFYVGGNNAGGTSSTGIVQFTLDAGLVIGLGKIMPESRPRAHVVPRYRYRSYSPYRY
ncbi:MAG: hypothetical protein JST47_00655 [Bacteroidetes bacterium]|nr:hypothetical protein [Bacteroidota bacterium]MBS1974244.1 hypothetical protein [Bacteroidota bacterium]